MQGEGKGDSVECRGEEEEEMSERERNKERKRKRVPPPAPFKSSAVIAAIVGVATAAIMPNNRVLQRLLFRSPSFYLTLDVPSSEYPPSWRRGADSPSSIVAYVIVAE